MSRVLVVGDLHFPAERSSYLEFVKKLKRKYKTDTTVLIGDVIDHNAISFHQKNPDTPSAMEEYGSALRSVEAWKKAFPECFVCIGNHDERVQRVGASVGIPQMYLRDFKEIYNTPKWEWDYSFIIDDVYYTHGTGSTSGIVPSLNIAKTSGMSTVSGHVHSVAAISWSKGPNNNKIFGFNVPTGVDESHKLMYYGRNYLKKPVNGAGVVIDGHPYMEIMD